jgi:predicted acetyltransferase
MIVPSELPMRPIEEDETSAFVDALAAAFGEELSEEAIAAELRIFERDRSLAVFGADGAIVATAGAYSFELALPGGASTPCSGITLVSVRQDHRRRGLLTRMMRHLMEDAIDRDEPVATLWASEGVIYGRYGFGPAVPHQRIQVPRAHLVLRDPVSCSDVELVRTDVAVERIAPLYDRARRQRPGLLSRNDAWWHHLVVNDTPDGRHGAGPRNVAVLPDGGYALYRLKPNWTDDGVADGVVLVSEIISLHPEATAKLWTFLATTDLAGSIRAAARPLDDPLPSMLVDASRARITHYPPMYVRLLDVPRAMEARGYRTDGAITLEVADPTFPDRSGTFHLDVSGGTGRCEPTDRAPELRMDMETLSTVYLGGVSPRVLAQARRIEEAAAGAVDRLDGLLSTELAPLQTSDY